MTSKTKTSKTKTSKTSKNKTSKNKTIKTKTSKTKTSKNKTIKNKTIKTSKNKTKTPRFLTNKADIISAIKNISKEDAIADFEKLCSTNCKTINPASKVGNDIMDHYFFHHRIETKSKRGINYFDWIKTNWKTNEPEYRLYKVNLANGKTPEKARYGVFRLYYGAVNGFKPLIARWLYCKYKPNTKHAILDFSAGWGGRCIGALSLGLKYIGIDTNTDLRGDYDRLTRDLQTHTSHTPELELVFKDSATIDYSAYDYDMVFTSPPYFKKTRPTEEYAHMPHYASREDFNTRFLFPAIERAWTHLKKGGVFALNVPMDVYEEIKSAKLLPPLFAKHPLYIQPRFAKGNPTGKTEQYKEYIYVWKKI